MKYISHIKKKININTKKIKYNLLSMLILFSKLKIGVSNAILATFWCIDKKYISKYILHGTACLYLYRKKYLINTKEKLSKIKDKQLHKMLNVSINRNIISGDGVRFEIYHTWSFNTQKLSFSRKHYKNTISLIGFNVLSNGAFIGFYPESCTGSDDKHWDGVVVDYITFTQNGDVMNWLEPNTKLRSNDGTLIVFDRALLHGDCNCYNHGVFEFKIPLGTNKNRPWNIYEANKTRLDVTCHRWITEQRFGVLIQKWRFFKFPIHPIHIPLVGVWLNILGAICNHLKIGVYERNEKRIKQLELIEMKKEQDGELKNIINPYAEILKKFRYEEDLKEKIGDGVNEIPIIYWEKCKTIQELHLKSKFWTKEKILKKFDFNNEELELIGGGCFTFNTGLRYLRHSKNEIGVYFSKHKDYGDKIMIRNIKKRLTIKKLVIERDVADDPNLKMHHVLFGQREKGEILIDEKGQFSKRVHSILDMHVIVCVVVEQLMVIVMYCVHYIF